MILQNSRRSFLAGMGVVAAGTAASSLPLFAFDGKAPRIRFGYASITWGKQDRQAIEDIAALGYPGIQMRANAVTDFQPAELRDLLQQHKLTLVALSSGEISLDPARRDETLATHTANAKFVRDVGGLYLQVLDQLKPRPRTVTPDECRTLGALLTELGKRTADLGIPLGYHNHLNTISERPADLDRVLDAADPKFVKLEFDTAHSVAGGGDPVKTIEKYHDRLLFLHLKDVVDIPPGTENARYPFKFVELGKGKVDLPGVFNALRKVGFSGWAVVELDRVPDTSKTPKECAQISKTYLEEKIRVKV